MKELQKPSRLNKCYIKSNQEFQYQLRNYITKKAILPLAYTQ